MRIHRILALSVLLAFAAGAASAEDAERIAAAVAPAPEDQRDSATVHGYSADGTMQTLREGDGLLVCLADDPRDERFHVACYHRDLDPFMARGRELKAAGKERAEILATREAEIEAGTLPFPRRPTALYSLTGKPGSYDPATGAVTGANRVYVIYTPFATAESTGLPASPMTPGGPWIMAPGKPWAHIMVIQAPEAPAEDENEEEEEEEEEEEDTGAEKE